MSISIIWLPAPFRRCEVPLWAECWTNAVGPLYPQSLPWAFTSSFKRLSVCDVWEGVSCPPLLSGHNDWTTTFRICFFIQLENVYQLQSWCKCKSVQSTNSRMASNTLITRKAGPYCTVDDMLQSDMSSVSYETFQITGGFFVLSAFLKCLAMFSVAVLKSGSRRRRVSVRAQGVTGTPGVCGPDDSPAPVFGLKIYLKNKMTCSWIDMKMNEYSLVLLYSQAAY
jgi:hypothetical protein